MQRYSIHDGPGIRTVAFLKGCPLDCIWCQNPEGKSTKPELMYSEKKCLRCFSCMKACTSDAITSVSTGITFDVGRCSSCGACAKVCPAQALVMVGKWVTADDLLKEVARDIPFYEESDGGVTFSGGEPLMQDSFLVKLLLMSKDLGISTAVETSGYASGRTLFEVAKHADILLYDIKVVDRRKHIRYTGVRNDVILENLIGLSVMGIETVIRFPLIPLVNDTEEDIRELAEFITSSTQFRDLNILPYHTGGVDKLGRLVRRQPDRFVTHPPNAEMLDRVKSRLMEYGLRVQIGG